MATATDVRTKCLCGVRGHHVHCSVWNPVINEVLHVVLRRASCLSFAERNFYIPWSGSFSVGCRCQDDVTIFVFIACNTVVCVTMNICEYLF